MDDGFGPHEIRADAEEREGQHLDRIETERCT